MVTWLSYATVKTFQSYLFLPVHSSLEWEVSRGQRQVNVDSWRLRWWRASAWTCWTFRFKFFQKSIKKRVKKIEQNWFRSLCLFKKILQSCYCTKKKKKSQVELYYRSYKVLCFGCNDGEYTLTSWHPVINCEICIERVHFLPCQCVPLLLAFRVFLLDMKMWLALNWIRWDWKL